MGSDISSDMDSGVVVGGGVQAGASGGVMPDAGKPADANAELKLAG